MVIKTAVSKTHLLKLLAVFLLSSVLLSACAAKTDEQKIDDRIHTFVKSYNTGDMNGVIACLDERSRNTYQAVSNLSIELGFEGLSAGLSVSDLFAIAVGAVSEDDNELLRIEIVNIDISSANKAKVNAEICFQSISGEQRQPIIISMVHEGSDWYISDMKDKR